MQLFDNFHIDDKVADAAWARHEGKIAKLKEKAETATDMQEKYKLHYEAAKLSIHSKLNVIMANMQVLLKWWTEQRLVFVDKGEGMFLDEQGCPFKERFQRMVDFMEEIDDKAKFDAAKRLVQCGTDEEAKDAMEQLKLDCEI